MANCRCCNENTLEEGNGNFEICSTCNWEDDPVQNDDIYLAGGANYYCLKEHHQLYLMLTGIVRRYIRVDVIKAIPEVCDICKSSILDLGNYHWVCGNGQCGNRG